MPNSSIPDVLTQHAEEAAFLWLLRDAAVHRPDYLLEEIAELDQRIEAHIDGLRVHGEPGWEIVLEQLEEFGEVGEVFAAGVLALESGDEARLNPVYEIGTSDLEVARGLISAFGWHPLQLVQKHIEKLFESDSPAMQRVGIAAAAIHRWDPGTPLNKALRSEDLPLRARAMRAVGELGQLKHEKRLMDNLDSEDEACRFWAAWSAVLLKRDDKGIHALRAIALEGGPYTERAVKLLMRADEPALSRRLIGTLIEKGDHRHACIAIGALGDPYHVPWLVERMTDLELARVAGETLCTITGIVLDDEGLEAEWPEGFEAGPTEEPEDENVEMDQDEDLAWPEPEKTAKWWDKNRSNYKDGLRYLVGQKITESHLQTVLKEGLQRQRTAAALEMALRNPENGLFETRAPGFRQ